MDLQLAMKTLEEIAYQRGWLDAIDACVKAQPCTAERPNEDTYQRGKFDGVMEYGRAIRNVGMSLDANNISERARGASTSGGSSHNPAVSERGGG